MSGETLASGLSSLANWLTYVAFLGLTGAVCGQLVVKPLCQQAASTAVAWTTVTERFLRAATVSVCLLTVAAAARLYAQTYSVFGLDEPVTIELLRLVGFETRWGGQWRPQLFATVLAVVAVVLIRMAPRAGWWGAALGVCALAATLPMTGHAMAHEGGSALPWTLQTGHGLAAGVWVGTLAVLFLVLARLRAEPHPDEAIAVLVHGFSPVAVGAVLVLSATGVWTSVLYLSQWGDLWMTPWGRALMLKVAVMLATGGVGAYNWRRLRPRLGTSAATRGLVRSSRLELLLAGLVLAVTAVLVHLPMSHE